MATVEVGVATELVWVVWLLWVEELAWVRDELV